MLTPNAISEIEYQAFFRQYGVFDPRLAQMLQSQSANDVFDVLIWYKASPADDGTQIMTTLAALVAPIHPFKKYPSAPLIGTSLTKTDLLTLQFHPDIARIYLDDATLNAPELGNRPMTPTDPTLFSALRTEHIPELWSRGYRGQDKKIGIIEFGKVSPLDALNVVGYEPTCDGLPLDNHATFVASVATANSGGMSGVAPDAAILSACTQDGSEFYSSLNWVFDQGADVANVSLSRPGSPDLDSLDVYVDTVARWRNKFISVAAGNDAGFVGSPGKGWNILTVGGFLDNETFWWNDDVMWVNSSYTNPISRLGDREKPEVVAVGYLTSYYADGSLVGEYGTSHASPQVAGLAALLMNVNPNLSNYPQAVKAIIMASAVHNLKGSRSIPGNTGQPRPVDLKDGAGGIHGYWAYEIAKNSGEFSNWFPCTYSCWWTLDDTSASFPVGERRGVKILATKGERVRVVVSWWNDPTRIFYGTQAVSTDYDLYVKNDDGILIQSSYSADNNYEMVDFTAPADGLYRIEVEKYATEEESNTLAIAALVFTPLRGELAFPNALYAPTIRRE